jgi:hypothetical protein
MTNESVILKIYHRHKPLGIVLLITGYTSSAEVKNE